MSYFLSDIYSLVKKQEEGYFMSNLSEHLRIFSEKVNQTKQLRILLKKWSPEIIIKPENNDELYSIEIDNSLVKDIHTAEQNRDHVIRLEAENDILEQIFSGQRNPARASIDGLLKIYGTNKDEVKLDAISLVLWGV